MGVLLVLIVSSCGVRRPDDRMIAADYLGRVMSRNVARGRNRYEVVCVPCHGDHDERQGPLLAQLRWTPPEIRHQVREGNSLMPAIPRNRLSDEDLEHLLAFFLTTGACVPDDDGLWQSPPGQEPGVDEGARGGPDATVGAARASGLGCGSPGPSVRSDAWTALADSSSRRSP